MAATSHVSWECLQCGRSWELGRPQCDGCGVEPSPGRRLLKRVPPPESLPRWRFRAVLVFLILVMLLLGSVIVALIVSGGKKELGFLIPLLLASEIAFVGLLRKKVWAWWVAMLVLYPLPLLMIHATLGDIGFYLSGQSDLYCPPGMILKFCLIRSGISALFLVPLVLLLGMRRRYFVACEKARGSFRRAIENARAGRASARASSTPRIS